MTYTMPNPILAPVVVLVLWTLVMLVWLYALRIPAIRRVRLPLDPNRSKEDFFAALPPSTRWPADNYAHLLEQPTIFYAIALTLVLLGHGGGLNADLAWLYVALRIIHSLVQATVNAILVRFWLFIASSVVLAVLALRAAIIVF